MPQLPRFMAGWVVVFLLLPCIVILTGVAFGTEIPVEVALNPRFSFAGPGDTFKVSIEITTPDTLSGFEMRLDFGESLVNVLAVKEGSLMKNSGLPTFWSVIKTTGEVHVDDFILGQGNVVCGPGELVEITFGALSPGYGHLTFTLCRLLRGVNELPGVTSIGGSISVSSTTDSPIGPRGDGRIALSSYPNPFAGRTTIHYENDRFIRGSLKIYSIAGELIKEHSLDGRSGTLQWDCRDSRGETVSPGVYLCACKFGNSQICKKLLVVK